MFKKELNSLITGVTLENPNEDKKQAKRVGQYQISSKAIYKADGTYVPFEAVKECVHDKTSVHVAGCCAGGVYVDRIIFVTDNENIPMIFDNEKQVNAVLEAVGR